MPKRAHAFNINSFYSELKIDYNKKLSEAMDLLAASKDKLEHARRKIENHADEYKIRLDTNLSDYNEWKENKYIDGTLQAKSAFIFRNRKDDKDDILVKAFVKYTALLKTIATCEKNIEVYYKILSLDLKAFRQICRIYYYEVQHQLIANGYGYKLAGRLGWVCINRVKNTNNSSYKILNTKGIDEVFERILNSTHNVALLKLLEVILNGTEYADFFNCLKNNNNNTNI